MAISAISQHQQQYPQHQLEEPKGKLRVKIKRRREEGTTPRPRKLNLSQIDEMIGDSDDESTPTLSLTKRERNPRPRKIDVSEMGDYGSDDECDKKLSDANDLSPHGSFPTRPSSVVPPLPSTNADEQNDKLSDSFDRNDIEPVPFTWNPLAKPAGGIIKSSTKSSQRKIYLEKMKKYRHVHFAGLKVQRSSKLAKDPHPKLMDKASFEMSDNHLSRFMQPLPLQQLIPTSAYVS
jgi:hypothetical protein